MKAIEKYRMEYYKVVGQLDEVPLEMKWEIMLYVNIPNVIKTSVLNKTWYRVILNDNFWKEYAINIDKKYFMSVTKDYMKEFENYVVNLKRYKEIKRVDEEFKINHCFKVAVFGHTGVGKTAFEYILVMTI